MGKRTRIDRQAAEAAGRRAEALAEAHLVAKGYAILDRRFRSGSGEIDIVARGPGLYAMVEVKSRPSEEEGLWALTPAAERRIVRAATIWLAENAPGHDDAVRFDVVTVTGGQIVHHEDAFRPGDDRRGSGDFF